MLPARVVLVMVLAAACAPAPRRPALDPASPTAPPGRLAGAPPSLRPGVVKYTDVPATPAKPPAPATHHHGH